MSTGGNVLVVYTDQQRFDTLGCNGNPLIRTPNLDRFAAEGVRCERAYVNCPLCVPSRVSFFTGLPAGASGSMDNGTLMKPEIPDFVTAFREAGYHTALIGKDHCFGPERLARTFDAVRQAGHTAMDPDLSPAAEWVKQIRAGTMGLPLAEDPVPPEHNITGSLFRAAEEYVRDRADAPDPFFLWLSIPDPHPPYMVSEPYAGMYRDVDVPLPRLLEGEMDAKPDRQKLVVASGRLRKDYPDDEALRNLKRVYWGMVSCIDGAFGRLMRTLEEAGLAETTWVVFTSDHGDFLGDHGLIRKGTQLYESLVHVPLLVRGPGVLAGKSTSALVSNLDVIPTLADLAGVALPAGHQGRSFRAVLSGGVDRHRAAVPLTHGKPGQALRRDQMTDSEWAGLKARPDLLLSPEVFSGRVTGWVNARWKYCRNQGDVDELYDLQTDPEELFNRAEDPACGLVCENMTSQNRKTY